MDSLAGQQLVKADGASVNADEVLADKVYFTLSDKINSLTDKISFSLPDKISLFLTRLVFSLPDKISFLFLTKSFFFS